MSQWKQHGGASRNRNLKATSVLFTRSNFWQRGDNLELYHDNDGSTTYVGIGTTKPFSRLSFGDTAVQRRVDYANDGGFYTGIWGSNVGFSEDSSGDLGAGSELDFYFGYAFETDAGLGIDISYVDFMYPGATNLDFQEIGVALSYGDAGFGGT